MVQAGSMGVPYVPVLGLLGSDLLKGRKDMQVLPDPFDPAHKTVVVKALRPEVALFHGLKADRAGNVHFGYESDNVILAEASRRVLVTVEEVVDALSEEERARTFLPGILVDAVADARFGAHPAGCPDAYPVDDEHMAWYAAQSLDDAAFADYLRQTVFEAPTHDAYVQRFVPEGWRQSGQRPLQVAGS